MIDSDSLASSNAAARPSEQINQGRNTVQWFDRDFDFLVRKS
jgi:hypothetical protein